MIYDFALEPELVASWHDPRVAYPVLCQMGLGHRRVGCAFPSAAWRGLVMSAFQATWTDGDAAAAQQAKKRMEVLLRHLEQTGTRRSGRLAAGDEWITAAIREHGQFPFGGILVRDCHLEHAFVVAAERLALSNSAAWSPLAPPVVRQARELAAALGPLLRCAAELRFIDPYFDADDATFYKPMSEYLKLAQQRRAIGDLQLQLHFAVRPREVEERSSIEGRSLNEREVALLKLEACEQKLGPLLQPGVRLQTFAWGRAPRGIEMHNRYLLSDVGGIAVQTGLDESLRAATQTDDLTVLSKEQHAARWAEFSASGVVYRKIADRVITRP